MKKVFILTLLSITILSLNSCKSKQQVTTIPAAYVTASSDTVPSSTPEVTPAPVVSTPVSSQPEEVRDEKFELDKEENNTQAINQKYHVVVGSFKNRDNAKGLQNSLNNEGNEVTIVVNEHGMYRVLIASYNEYQQAREKINQISSRFPDAWVLTQKK